MRHAACALGTVALALSLSAGCGASPTASDPVDAELPPRPLSQADVALRSLAPEQCGALAGRIEGVDSGRRPVLSLQRRWQDGVWRPFQRDIVVKDGRISASLLDPGRYVLLTRVVGHEVSSTKFVAKRGETTEVVVRPGARSDIAVSLSMPDKPDETLYTFNLNRVGVLDSDAAHGTLRSKRMDLPGMLGVPRPGEYLFLFWRQGVCVPVQISREPKQAIVLPIPRTPFGPGPGILEVRVEKGERAVSRMCVCIRSKGDTTGLMRFRGTNPMARFEGLKPGSYEVLVYDGALGIFAGFGPHPLRRVVEVEPGKQEIFVRAEAR